MSFKWYGLETYQVGAHFEALDEGVLLVPLYPRYTQVGFNVKSVQVCIVVVPADRCVCHGWQVAHDHVQGLDGVEWDLSGTTLQGLFKGVQAHLLTQIIR